MSALLTMYRTSTVVVQRRQRHKRATFCPEFGAPCLMAGMDPDIISEGCLGFVKPKVAHIATIILEDYSSFDGLSC